MTPEHLYMRTADLIKGNLWQRFPVINVDKTTDIPADYPGMMGVPITFLDKWNPGQFAIYGVTNHWKLVNGREPFRRILIRNLKPDLPEVIDVAAWFRAMGVPLDVQPVTAMEPGEKIEIAYRGREATV